MEQRISHVRRHGLTLGSAVGRAFPKAASVVDRGEAQAERHHRNSYFYST